MKIESGIYMLRNKENGKVYIGQSKYLQTRKNSHRRDMRHRKHANPYIQSDADKYGVESFEFIILEKCDPETLDEREIHYINLYDSSNSEKGYNVASGGSNPTLPEGTKEKMRMSARGKNNKLTVAQIEEIKTRRLEGESLPSLAQAFGVKVSTINKITMCKNWEYVRPDLSEALLNQSRLEDERRADLVKKMYAQGKRPNTIHRETGISNSSINRYLADELENEKETAGERNPRIIEDFFARVPVPEIIEKYGVTYPQYKRITKGLQKEREIRTYEEIMRRKEAGQLHKDIAKDLGINRSTVVDLLAKYSVQANTEVSDQIAKG